MPLNCGVEDVKVLNCGVVFLRVPWTARRSNQSMVKGYQSRIFIWRTDAEAEAPILVPPDAKNWLIRKDPDAGKDWTQEEKGKTEDEMVGWYHWLDGHEFEQIPGDGDGQGNLACCSPWGCKELDMSEWLNWTECLLQSFPDDLKDIFVRLVLPSDNFPWQILLLFFSFHRF